MTRPDETGSNRAHDARTQAVAQMGATRASPDGDPAGAERRRPNGSARGSLRISVASFLLLSVVTLLAHDSKPGFKHATSAPVREAMLLASPASAASASAVRIGTNSPEHRSVKHLEGIGRGAATSLPASGFARLPSNPGMVAGAAGVESIRSSGRATSIVGGSMPRAASRKSPNVTTAKISGQTGLSIRHSTADPASSAQNVPLSAAHRVSPANLSIRPLAVTLAPHPRLLLDASTLAMLRQRAASKTSEWKLLKATCDSYIGGTVAYPTGTAYPDLPNLGSGYQGSSYLPALLAEGMCYQVLKSSDAAAAQSYGAKAVDILMKMSAPYPGSNGWNPCTDNGYGIRFYGVGYGLGYDWVYELLTSAQRTQIYTTANAWVTAWEQPNGCADFEYAHPQSNYFAGYFHAKAVISLATYDENPAAPAQWVDWLANQFGTRVQPYYQTHLLGGGWPEGYGNYAPLGILNMSLPAWEVKSATGTDLINASAPYSFPLASADYAMHFTWPSRAYFDDRDTNHSSGDVANPPGTTPVGMFEQILGSLIYWNSPKVAVFHQYLNEVSAATKDFSPAEAWQLFLFTDPSASTAALNTLPLSYFAPGMNAVAARSGWDNGAAASCRRQCDAQGRAAAVSPPQRRHGYVFQQQGDGRLGSCRRPLP